MSKPDNDIPVPGLGKIDRCLIRITCGAVLLFLTVGLVTIIGWYGDLRGVTATIDATKDSIANLTNTQGDLRKDIGTLQGQIGTLQGQMQIVLSQLPAVALREKKFEEIKQLVARPNGPFTDLVGGREIPYFVGSVFSIDVRKKQLSITDEHWATIAFQIPEKCEAIKYRGDNKKPERISIEDLRPGQNIVVWSLDKENNPASWILVFP